MIHLRAGAEPDDGTSLLAGVALALGSVVIVVGAIALLVSWMLSWDLAQWIRAAACALLLFGSGLLFLALLRIGDQFAVPARNGPGGHEPGVLSDSEEVTEQGFLGQVGGPGAGDCPRAFSRRVSAVRALREASDGVE